MSDVPELRQFFNKKLITNGEYLNDKDFEEATFKPQAKLRTAGWKLPKTTESWDRVNKSMLDVNKEVTNVDGNICELRDTIYEYFKNECGTVSENDIYAELHTKYDHLPKRELKRTLCELKRENNNW